jgi:integrase
MVSFYLDKKGSDQDSPIFLTVRFNGKRLKVYTGRKILEKSWDVEKGRANPKKYKNNCIGFNQYLQALNDASERLLNENRPITKADLKAIVDKNDNLKHGGSFFEFAEEFLRTSDLAYNSKKGFRTTLNHVKAFRPQITFTGFDMTFYREFVNYLREKKGLGENTVGDSIKRIKRLLNVALDENLHTSLDFKKKSFKTPSIINDEVYLTNEELLKFYEKDLPPQLAKFRDGFLLHVAFGIRFEDGIQIVPSSFDNIDGTEFLKVIQGKTGVTVQIPILDKEFAFVKPILEKYGYTHPCLRKGRLVSVQKFNEYLRDAAKAAELDTVVNLSINGDLVTKKKHQCIKSHTARRTFSTLLFLAEYPIQLIMAATGHKKESTFLKYVRADQLTTAKKLATFKKSPLKVA